LKSIYFNAASLHEEYDETGKLIAVS